MMSMSQSSATPWSEWQGAPRSATDHHTMLSSRPGDQSAPPPSSPAHPSSRPTAESRRGPPSDGEKLSRRRATAGREGRRAIAVIGSPERPREAEREKKWLSLPTAAMASGEDGEAGWVEGPDRAA